MPPQAPNDTQTLEITNFGGRLTRVLNGELNSGFAKFTQSFGYDPFSKPMNLTWLEAPVSITGPITNLIVAAKARFSDPTNSGFTTVYAIDSGGKLYNIQANNASGPNVDSVIGIASVMNGTTYNFGAAIDFYGSTEKIYVSHDTGVNSINFDGTSETQVATSTNAVVNIFHPLLQFLGALFFGNKNNIGRIDTTGTVISSVASNGQVNPPLPQETYITDLDLSPDGNYMYLTASNVSNENINTAASDRQSASAGNGTLYKWNGTDVGITSQNFISSYQVTALQTYLSNNIFFANDTFGSSINDGTNKLLTLTNNKSPFSNATVANGNFLTWVAPEINSTSTNSFASLYYFGQLDGENQPGLWRMCRQGTGLTGGFIYQTPLNILVNNRYQSVNNALTSLVSWGYGKHYFSVWDLNSTTNSYKLYRFLITPTGTGTPQLGVYETQTQLFSKRARIKQIRVYTEPTAANNGFQIDCIGSDGAVITNGTFTYTFAAGTDVTKLQGALERIDFNPAMKDTFALGLRITNTGTVNMTIKKIEIDYMVQGK